MSPRSLILAIKTSSGALVWNGGVAHWKESLVGFVWVICYQARTSKHSTVSAIFLFPHIHKEMQREKEIKELWTGKVGFACLQQMPNMRSIFSTIFRTSLHIHTYVHLCLCVCLYFYLNFYLLWKVFSFTESAVHHQAYFCTHRMDNLLRWHLSDGNKIFFLLGYTALQQRFYFSIYISGIYLCRCVHIPICQNKLTFCISGSHWSMKFL